MTIKNIFFLILPFTLLFSNCEELDLDVRKLELTINGKVRQIEVFDTWNAAFDVKYTRDDLLDFFDIERDAEVSAFKMRSLELYYQPCEDSQADSVRATFYINEPNGGVTFLARMAGIDLVGGVTKNIKDLGKAHEFKLAEVFGGVTNVNGILKTMINDPSKSLSIKLESEHFPNGALVCGAMLIRLDMYIVYKECRAVPYGSKAGEPCE